MFSTPDASLGLLDRIAAAVGNPANGATVKWEALTQVPLFCQPGKGFRYGIGIDVLGHAAVVLAGYSNLSDLVQDKIFSPCGMVDTQWFVPALKANRCQPLSRTVPWLSNKVWLGDLEMQLKNPFCTLRK